MKKKLQQNKQSLAILLLLTAMVLVLLIILLRCNSVSQSACAQRLGEYTQEVGQEVQAQARQTQNYMNKVSGLIYDAYQDSEPAGRLKLSALGPVGMLTRMELLMPDGTLYTPSGPVTDPTLSFSDLAARGSGVIPRSVDQRASNRYITRIFTPVRRNGQTVAILCGVVDISRLAYLFPASAYDGEAQLFLVEGKSGSFLIDPWNDAPGSLQDLSRYTFSRGYSYDKLYGEVFNATAGSTVLRVSSTKYRLSYAPTGFQDWTVMLVVEDATVYAQTNHLRLLHLLLILLMAVFSAAFFLWFLHDTRKTQAHTDLRLQGARYMQDVQQTLFRAHVHPERFGTALDKVADYLAADAAMYFSLEHDQLILRTLSGAADKAPPKHSDLYRVLPQTARTVMAEGSFASSRPSLWGEQDYQAARSIGIRNIMLVRLNAMDGKDSIGILGAINTDVQWADDTTPLDQVALSFSMALENSRNYQTLAYMSQVDELTGVMNRNSYETRLAELSSGVTLPCLGCIYIDANGLHEINNHLGHDAGDEMLRSVADALLSRFEKKDVFRLGGDEFAVLVQGMDRSELELRAQKVTQSVEKVGYSVSLGLEWQENGPQVAQVVTAAEATMRQNKADYYANKGGERQMRNLNTRMEQTLAAKRDADSLLSALVPDFLGVYFVDPQKDACRSMVHADFFKDMLAQSKDSFQGALALYIENRVVPEDREPMKAFCRYDDLLPKLAAAGAQDLTFRYRRTDGQSVLLRVRQPRRAGDDQHEIMWLFSNDDPDR